MSAELWLYVVSVAHNIDMLSTVVLFATIIPLLILYIIKVAVFTDSLSSDETKEIINGAINKIQFIFLLTIPFNVLVPGEKTMYAMLATNVMSKSDIPQRVLNIIDAKLTELEADQKSHGR